MQTRIEPSNPPAKLLPYIETNPFYVNINYLFDPHYREGNADTTPFLYTTELTSCVGIGLIYRQDEKVKKLALYHSSTEHIACEAELIQAAIKSPFERNIGINQKNLIRALYRFFYDIADIHDVTVVIHSNNGPEKDSSSENDGSYDDVVTFVQQVLSVMGHEKLPLSHFLYSCQSPCFVVMNDGSFFAVQRGPEDEKIAEKIVQFIAEDILTANRKPKPLLGKSIFVEGVGRKVRKMDWKILHYAEQAQTGELTCVEACELMKKALEMLKKPKEASPYEKIKLMLQFLDDSNIFTWHRVHGKAWKQLSTVAKS